MAPEPGQAAGRPVVLAVAQRASRPGISGSIRSHIAAVISNQTDTSDQLTNRSKTLSGPLRPCPMWWGVVELRMGRGTWSWIVPDGLWEIAEPLIPPSRVRPQGGGTPDTPDETLFAAIIYVLVSGCAWRMLPPCFG
ncbi:transposase, partial [Streptomyces sp. NPDC058157]|uniref:transposase n=1 Tax=Streptomyces sp. NPDC058157 TaxID=3346360 RepID=UPI0036EF54D6